MQPGGGNLHLGHDDDESILAQPAADPRRAVADRLAIQARILSQDRMLQQDDSRAVSRSASNRDESTSSASTTRR
jgi:hypothetical protein